MRHKIFLAVTGIVFFGLAIIFLFFPRSGYSELERRELATFPKLTWDKLISGDFAAGVSSWFSDSGSYRDRFLEAHMRFKDFLALKTGGEDAVTFHAGAGKSTHGTQPGARSAAAEGIDGTEVADGTARIASNGIIVTGSGDNVRALMCYGGSGTGRSTLAEVANKMQRRLGGVRMYCMVVPTSIEYYCPAKVKDRTRSQLATIRNIYSQLTDGVRGVDVHSILGEHASEAIYLRTDHHWAPLGAFYAASRFAQVAGVNVPRLEEFDRHVVHDFVGTMYAYSRDINVKNAPEDFVYFTPKNTNYTTTYVIYKVDKDFKVTGKSAPHKGAYFHKFKDGNGGAYCTFMGTDMATVKVETGTRSPRRLLVIKDSFGNALPGYLFGSFSQVHVIDFRYFIGNIPGYVKDNGITDLLLVFNIFNAYSGSAASKLEKLLSGTAAVSKPSDPNSKPERSYEAEPEVTSEGVAPEEEEDYELPH